ncbi:MAG TPA: C-type lectin domain-containing protein [Kofleriaceae bacterium]|nr:C-type lectin domain-containing protein [Kofleriaceae bacterium]
MGKPGALGVVVLALAFAAACGADIGSGGPEERPTDGAPRADSAPAADAAIAYDARPPCEGGDATAEGADGTCIVYFATPATWDAARAACEGIGGTLAIIDNLAENNLVATIPPADPGLPDVWAAGTDAGTEAEWHWLAGGPVFWNAGTTVTFAHWRVEPPEPNNGGGTEHCMVLEADTIIAGEGYTWDDRPCDLAYSYFCET